MQGSPSTPVAFWNWSGLKTICKIFRIDRSNKFSALNQNQCATSAWRSQRKIVFYAMSLNLTLFSAMPWSIKKFHLAWLKGRGFPSTTTPRITLLQFGHSPNLFTESFPFIPLRQPAAQKLWEAGQKLVPYTFTPLKIQCEKLGMSIPGKAAAVVSSPPHVYHTLWLEMTSYKIEKHAQNGFCKCWNALIIN